MATYGYPAHLICVVSMRGKIAELFAVVDTMSTPKHIVPEWYLLFLYAILRCIPDKTCGWRESQREV